MKRIDLDYRYNSSTKKCFFGYWACKIVTSVPEELDNSIPNIGIEMKVELH